MGNESSNGRYLCGDVLVGWRLVTLGTLMRRVLDHVLQPLDVRCDQVQALDLLATAGTLTVRDLGLNMGLERNSASQLVERLVQRGLVQRMRQPNDRRRCDVTLQPRGRELLAAAKPRAVAVHEALVSGLAPEDNAMALRLAADVLDLLQQQLANLESGSRSGMNAAELSAVTA